MKHVPSTISILHLRRLMLRDVWYRNGGCITITNLAASKTQICQLYSWALVYYALLSRAREVCWLTEGHTANDLQLKSEPRSSDFLFRTHALYWNGECLLSLICIKPFVNRIHIIKIQEPNCFASQLYKTTTEEGRKTNYLTLQNRKLLWVKISNC